MMESRENGYTREQLQAINKERVRVARDLHDGPLQIITHISHKLEFVQRLLERQAGDHALDELQKVRVILATCLHTFRQDISLLMQTALAHQNIADALFNLIADFKISEPGVELTSVIDALDSLPPELIEPLFRFVQETLNNVRKHAHATKVRLSILLSSTQLVVEVCDNGIGMLDEVGNRDSMGLRILHERVQEVEGTLTVRSASNEGTSVKAVFPIALH